MAKNYPGNARNKSIWQTFADQYPFKWPIHPKLYISSTKYKHWKKGAHQTNLGRQKTGWFLAD